ncbi:flagellin [Rhodovulum steppense]|uniref:Flagellin n=1 Tax=Rhodovulum steppense TaxID=540251 RepID=A0A4R1Z0F7_9RHOB|nr:flagellin [Rhodovulum steppense]TCM87049.1 flagellin [Rhodovulum steppense]
MSSINTNSGAMVALQTLKGINNNLAKVQSEISTGKSIDSAKDNAAVWAIAKTMEADVSGFKKISDGLSGAEATVSVARNAAESITDLLKDMKDQIVQSVGAANDEERTKIQANVNALREQVASVVGAAQFNGVNLIDGTAGTMEVLSSLNRDSAGLVTSAKIDVASQDLSIGDYTAKDAFSGTTGASTNGDAAAFSLDATGGSDDILILDATYEVGDSLSVRIGEKTVTHTFSQADIDSTTPEAVAATSLKAKIEALGISGLEVDYDAAAAGTLSLTNNGANDLSVSMQFKNAGTGGLGALEAINVSDATGATNALAAIDGLIKTSIDAAAAFGTSQNQLETQNDFVSKLMDSMKTGIGSMVDADMEAVSARLQALQVQQQLATQSLSIANQAPQNLLSLFR